MNTGEFEKRMEKIIRENGMKSFHMPGIKRMVLEQELIVDTDVIERVCNEDMTLDDCVLVSGLLSEYYRKVNAEREGESDGL